MAVRVLSNGELVWCNVREKVPGSFELQVATGQVIELYTPLNLDLEFEKKDFEIHFLSKKGVRESEVYQVFERSLDKRLGWAIPVTSLSSDLHDYSNNIHFLRYAYVATKYALNELDGSVYSNSVEAVSDSFKLSDVFHEDTVFLVLSKDTFEEDFEFDINKVAPSLIKYGYVVQGKRDPSAVIHEIDIDPGTRKIYLERVSDSIIQYDLISDLMNSLFSYEGNPIFRFFYLYQIFEILIDCVYREEQASVVSELISVQGDSGKSKEVLERFNSIVSEKNRYNLLFKDYMTSEVDLVDLRNSCNRLLKAIDRTEANQFSGYFYTIRNFIFHQYRDFPMEESYLLDSVIHDLLQVLPKILCNFAVHNGADS